MFLLVKMSKKAVAGYGKSFPFPNLALLAVQQTLMTDRANANQHWHSSSVQSEGRDADDVIIVTFTDFFTLISN